ncbi:hypothetical protein BGAL_0479g00090 [Botrytis galanthina]|uniref:Uncharacterized protein n=1 Tax=Botrytis galanthina TaxID=278940 RepID=A0A4S8QKW6_9HELO|nr:hypothetical protein BGAL_0479g00090 [Botrytis galanthina]
MDVEMFIGDAELYPDKNAALTVALYLSEAYEDFLDQPEKHLTFFSQLPDPIDAPVLFLPTEQKFEDPKSDLWRQGSCHLDDVRGIPGLFIPRGCVTHLKVFPLTEQPPYHHFRRLWFAIWDRKRMFCFGLANEDAQPELIYNSEWIHWITVTPIWTVIQTTISERVSISGFLYTVTSGSITVNGVGYSVPAVVNSSVMVLGGLTATLYPPAVVSSVSITAPGYGTNPLTPTSTVVPVKREQEVLFSIYNQGNTLSPGGPAYTYVYTDPTGINVIAQANWAYNVFICDDESIDDNYGGAHIWDGPFGCIEYMIYAVKSGSGSSTCSCSENGCTPDSPACCADGTCDGKRKSVMNRVTLIPGSLGLVGDQNTTLT